VPSRQNLVLSVIPQATAPSNPQQEIEIVVTGQAQEDNYAVPNSNVGTRTDAAIKDVPQSIQVIPQQVIKDQGETELNDALRNASGISQDGLGQVNIRGFGASDNILSDGASINVVDFVSDFSLGNVEQIEVLKGPASVLYGTGAAGGTVNLTTKQPLREPRYEIGGRIGNFDYYNPSLDLTGPLNGDKTILYRLNIDYENTGSFVDFTNSEQIAIFPVLSFQLSKNTNLTIEGGYRDQNNEATADGSFASYLPAIGTVLPNPQGEVPLSRNLGEPDFDRNSILQWNIGYLINHKFNDNWSARNRFSAIVSDFQERQIFPDVLEEDNRTVTRLADDRSNNDENYTLQTDVQGKIQTGIVKQDLLLGVELERNIYDTVSLVAEASPIDLFEPEYGNIPDESDFEVSSDEKTASDAIGIYAQDLFSIGDQVKIALGGRFDWVFQDFENRAENTLEENNDTAFAPRAGIVYQPIKPVSLYGGWSRSFEPQIGFDRLGEPFIPITGEQFEVGVKTDFFDNKLSTTLAAYQITRQNDFQPDPIDPDNFDIQIGEQRSRGIELDVSGEPLPGLSLIASYAYTDAEITEDTTGLEGTPIVGIPEHSGSLWTVYEIQKGNFAGFGLGAGVFVTGERTGGNAEFGGTFKLPAQAITNALLYYRRDNWRVQLNLDNIFDADDIRDASTINSVFPGAPFTVRGQISAEF
ncbi:MAG: TonB-dependent siderophore receptor, partial [Waterburya sp.]